MIQKPQSFRDCLPAGFDGVFDWDFLLPAFEGSKIQPMDLDCIVERNGWFLVIETKRPGVAVPRGQQITLERLVQRGNLLVIILRAKTATEINGWEKWSVNSDRSIRKESICGNSRALVEFVKNWKQSADQDPRMGHQ